jgi:hypothetical protein
MLDIPYNWTKQQIVSLASSFSLTLANRLGPRQQERRGTRWSKISWLNLIKIRVWQITRRKKRESSGRQRPCLEVSMLNVCDFSGTELG